ncbi:MAG: L-threonylcarbamoyladenylate synthase [Rhodospirillales bacterium]|nr:L-threonylcarbamoyladenylate synthase [Rhodospirillales bacterium]
MSNIYSINPQNMQKAAQIIKDGGLVAFPTETVYGLGANAYDAKAVASIFAAKGRPTFNPLISHIADIDFLKNYVEVDERALALAHKFWPGPFTMVLKRKEHNTAIDLACAGLPTATVRMPNHPVALELIRLSGVPIVAPSANRSQTISPTTAEHVAESLGDKVDMILDGGKCAVGVESTIVDVTGKEVFLLRAGGIAKEDIENFLHEKVFISHGDPNKPSSPGQMLRHYAPEHRFRINVEEPEDGEFYIGFGYSQRADLNLSVTADLHEAAANLFAYMRLADNMAGEKGIAIAPIPEEGLGLAINDRIRRASYAK